MQLRVGSENSKAIEVQHNSHVEGHARGGEGGVDIRIDLFIYSVIHHA